MFELPGPVLIVLAVVFVAVVVAAVVVALVPDTSDSTRNRSTEPPERESDEGP